MKKHNGMRPQDIAVLLAILPVEKNSWTYKGIAQTLEISQSEISESLNRSKIAGLINSEKKKVNRLALLEFLQHGLSYVFPVEPAGLARGIPTAHSAPPLNNYIHSEIPFVWATAKGTVQGLAVEPLYPNLPQAALTDKTLYSYFALVDSLRVGRQREKQLAIKQLEKKILNNAEK